MRVEALRRSVLGDDPPAAAEHRALLIAKIATELKPILTPDQVSKIESAWSEVENLIDERFAKAGE